MKLEDAIKIREEAVEKASPTLCEEYLEADKLGIEALKRVEAARVKGTIWDYSLLPGETS